MDVAKPVGSTLPPLIVTPARAPRTFTLPTSSAASADAPLGSTTSFNRSNANRMAPRISSSVTVTTPAARARTMGHVNSPGAWVCWPSAIVFGTGIEMMRFSRHERTQSSPASGSTP